MRTAFAAICFFLIMLQVIPVAQILAAEDVHISWIDDDKDSKTKEKKEGKEFFGTSYTNIYPIVINTTHFHLNSRIFSFPVLEYLTPPPDQGF